METKTYKCPCCNKTLSAKIPNQNAVTGKGYWDGVTTCTHCNEEHFKKVWPSGKIEVVKLSIVLDGKLWRIYIQPLIGKSDLSNLFCPVLKFGRKRSDELRFPIVFKSEKKCNQICDELEKLIGKSYEEVKIAGDLLFETYKQFDYRVKKQKAA